MSKDLKISVLCDIYGALLPEKQRKALELYYYDDLSLSEIAEQSGISRQGVRDQIKHAETQLHSFEDSLGLCEKSEKTDKITSELEKIAKEIDNKRLSELVLMLRSLNE